MGKHDEPKENEPTMNPFIIDSQSPYFLRPSDLLGAIIITVRLNGINYNMWEQAVRTTLKAINKLAFIDGELSRPENKDGKQIAGVNTWDMVNSTITSWIVNMIDLKQMLE